MADFAKSIVRVIKAENEARLEQKLFEIQISTQQYIEVINVYPKGSNVFAWIRIDARNQAALPKIKEKDTIKSTKKKRTKKKS